MDTDIVVGRRRQVLTDEVRADGQLTVAAVDEHRETDRARPSVVDERVHCRADRPAGEQHIVDEDDDAVVDRKRDLRRAHDRGISDAGQVVAVQRDVDGTERQLDPFVVLDRGADSRRERVTARANTDDGEKGEVAIALDDLVRDPRDGAADIVRGKQRGRLALLPGLTGPDLKVTALDRV